MMFADLNAAAVHLIEQLLTLGRGQHPSFIEGIDQDLLPTRGDPNQEASGKGHSAGGNPDAARQLDVNDRESDGKSGMAVQDLVEKRGTRIVIVGGLAMKPFLLEEKSIHFLDEPGRIAGPVGAFENGGAPGIELRHVALDLERG